MNTIEELKDYLTEQNLSEVYTDTTGRDLFKGYTTAAGIDRQRSFAKASCEAKWWIDYNKDIDEFELKVGYFNKTGVSISKEEFINIFTEEYPERVNTIPAVLYNEDSKLRWSKVAHGYSVQLPENPVFRFPIITIIPKV